MKNLIAKNFFLPANQLEKSNSPEQYYAWNNWDYIDVNMFKSLISQGNSFFLSGVFYLYQNNDWLHYNLGGNNSYFNPLLMSKNEPNMTTIPY